MFVAAVVGTVSRHSLTIEAHHRNQLAMCCMCGCIYVSHLRMHVCIHVYIHTIIHVQMPFMHHNLFLNIEIPPVEDLMVADQCTIIRASWDITEGSCTHLSYYVTLLSSDGVILQGPFTINDTVYYFASVETLNGTFYVSVVPINGNLKGASVTEMAVILQGG